MLITDSSIIFRYKGQVSSGYLRSTLFGGGLILAFITTLRTPFLSSFGTQLGGGLQMHASLIPLLAFMASRGGEYVHIFEHWELLGIKGYISKAVGPDKHTVRVNMHATFNPS